MKRKHSQMLLMLLFILWLFHVDDGYVLTVESGAMRCCVLFYCVLESCHQDLLHVCT